MPQSSEDRQYGVYQPTGITRSQIAVSPEILIYNLYECILVFTLNLI